MNGLAQQGFVLFTGPLARSEHGRLRALLIVDADSEADLTTRLAHDPWTTTEQLKVTSIEPWNLFAGAQRLTALGAASMQAT
jgi:uncharacterized protein YciI